MLRHEAGAVGEFELGAFATQCLGDEKAAVLGVIEAGGVKLHELHIRHTTARTPGHGHAIACGGFRVAGVAIDLARPPGGEHNGRSGHGLHLTGFQVECIEAIAGLGGLACTGLAVR